MQSARAVQISAIALAGGLVAFLFLNGKNNSSALVDSRVHAGANTEALNAMQNDGFNFALLEKDTKSRLSKSDNEEILLLESARKGRGKTLDYTQKLGEKYDKLHQPALAGYYYLKVAEEKPQDEKIWALAGKKFFEAQGTVTDTQTYHYFVDLSIKAYEKALALDPNDKDATIDQAVNYAEGKGDNPMNVMKGVGMLKKIEQADPDNKRMLLYLGMLSMRSGQVEKAVGRFERLTQLPADGDKNYPFYFRYLGEAYKSAGENTKAFTAFRQYKMLIRPLGDKRLTDEADQLIASVQ